MRGKNEPDPDALDREARWELVGCAILLAIALLMAVAINFHGP